MKIFNSEYATAENFDEVGYLYQNPDVARAVALKGFQSGTHHFNMGGATEGRRQVANVIWRLERAEPETFDEQAYLIANEDVARAVASGIYASGWDHFVENGRREQRSQFMMSQARPASSLSPLTLVHGGTAVFADDPAITMVEDAVYIPHGWRTADASPNWGIYKNGELVRDTAFIRGPGENAIGQTWRVEEPQSERSPSEIYIYAGDTHPHFGHFLISSMDRLWHSERKAKFLIHCRVPPDIWFKIPFVTEILTALGVSREDFVWFDKPTRIPRLIVPGPSFRELHSAHQVYGDLGRRVGDTLRLGRVTEHTYRPAYLAKHNVESGVWQFKNEKMLIEQLELLV